MVFFSFAALLGLAAPVSAAPLLRSRDATSSLIGHLTPKTGTLPVNVTHADIEVLALQNAAYLAGAAYCPSTAAKQWDCKTCKGVPDVQVLYTQGDGKDNPRLYVGYSKALDTVIVGHEGTEDNIEAWLGDFDAILVPMDSSLDNGDAPASIQVHQGFQLNYLNFSVPVLQAVNDALAGVAKGCNNVVVVGHSLGAASSVFSGLNLKLSLPSTINLQVTTFGQPRVGNSDFASYLQNVLGDGWMHVTNYNDLVPHVPPVLMGYEQTITELWLDAENLLSLCPGVENDACAAGVPDLELSVDLHNGPYFGVMLGPSHAC